MMRLPLILLLILSAGTYLFSQTGPTYQTYVLDPKGAPRNHNVDMEKLQLKLAFEPEAGKVAGEATYTFRPLQEKVDTLFLDAPGIAISSVEVNNKTSRFRISEAGLTIYFTPALEWGSTHNLQINYTATPKAGIYFVGWNEDTKSIANDPDRIRKQIWTQGQGTDNRYWIPSYDAVNDKLITELSITFDKQYEVISNGVLKDLRNNGDGKTKTWDYAMEHPHVNYLIMLAIGEYKHKDYISKNGITSRQYYYPDREECVEPTYQYSSEMMDWLSEETGLDYPWSTYANVPVQEFLYGAMENTTATIFTDALFQDVHAQSDRSYIAVNAHELAHQWFGDYVTAWSGTDHWLQESFATHYSKKFRESVMGPDEFQWIRRQEMLSAINADNRDDFPLAHSEAGSSRHYPKGSFVLDMMRYVLGNEQYRKVITDYLNAHPYDNVRSGDLEIQCMRSLGMNMQWFFDQWVYRAGYPVYVVSHSATPEATSILVKQAQDSTKTQGLFRMPVVFQVHYTDGGFDEQTAWISERETTVLIPNTMKKEVAFVLFDPGTEILSAVQFKKPYQELRYQAFNAPLMLDRYDAITEMGEFSVEEKREDLLALYAKGDFYAIKEEIISQLANDDNKKVLAMLQTALKDPRASVRKSVVSSLKTVPSKLEKDIVLLLNDTDYGVVETTLRFLAEKQPERLQSYLDATAGKYGVNKNIRITWLELSYGNGQKEAARELTTYVSGLYEFRTRNTGMQAIRRINYCDAAVADNLVDAYLDYNRRLSGPAKGLLTTFLENEAYAPIVRTAIDKAKQTGGDAEKLNKLLEPKKD